MKKMSSLLVARLIMLSAAPVMAKIVNHTSTVDLNKLIAFQSNSAPGNDFQAKQCLKQYSSLLGSTAKLHYHINIQSEKEIATISLWGENNIVLDAAGIAHGYYFISNGVPTKMDIFKKVLSIAAVVDSQFTNKKVKILFRGGPDYNCTLVGETTT